MGSSHIILLDGFYPDLSIIPDPTYYWKCAEVSGDLIDAAGNMDMPEIGTVPSTTTGYRGIFVDNTDYFRKDPLPNNDWNNNLNPYFLLSICIKTTRTNDIIIDKENGLRLSTVTLSDGDGGFINTVRLFLHGDNLTGISEVQDGAKHWVQIGSAYNSSTIRMYVDGILQGTAENEEPVSQVSALTVGVATPGNNGAFDGEVREIFYVPEHTVTDWNVLEVAFAVLRKR